MQSKPHPWFDPAFLVGTELQGYLLETLLGYGGFGSVYRTSAPDRSLRALKVLYPPQSMSEQDNKVWDTRATHFQREARAAGAFNHPNIIKVYDSGLVHWKYSDQRKRRKGEQSRSGNYPLMFYVAEYIPDGVDKRLNDGRLFTADAARAIALQVCDALSALHQAKPPIIHRDLNPGNVLLAPDGGLTPTLSSSVTRGAGVRVRAVLTDFGVARIEGLPEAYVTSEGPMLHRGIGAPEQFMGGRIDERTDIYQCGALLFAMLTGQYPRQVDLRMSLGRKDTPERLALTVLRCLESDPAKRFKDAASLKASLARAGESGPVQAPPRSRAPARQVSKIWEVQLPRATWRTAATPAAESEDAARGELVCHLWDNDTVYWQHADSGREIAKWKPAADRRKGDVIGSSLKNPSVRVFEKHAYVRHGSSLSCHDFDGTPRWRYEHWSDLAGNFALAGAAAVIDSYQRYPEAPLQGPAALDGEALWVLPPSPYHADALAASSELVVLVESLGVGGSRGLRVRFVDAVGGEVRHIHEIDRLDADGALQTPRQDGGLPMFKALAPVMAADGSVLVGLGELYRRGLTLLCFDASLALRWSKTLDMPDAPGAPGRAAVAAGGGCVLVCQAAGRDSGLARAVITGLDMETGAVMWTRTCADDALCTDIAMAADRPVAFALFREAGWNMRKGGHWRLGALDVQTGAGLWKGPERVSPAGAGLVAPALGSFCAYLQVPLEAPRTRGAVGLSGRAVIEAYRWG